MNILFWMSTSFQTTSRHLLIAILDELSKSGNCITVLKKKVDDETEELPEELAGSGIRCISIPFKASGRGNLIARYLKDIEYTAKCKRFLNEEYDAVFVQSSNVAGFVFRILHKKQPKAFKTFNVQDIFPQNAVYSGTLSKDGIPYRVLKHVQCSAYKNADRIITISEDMKQLLVDDCGVESEKIEVIYNWSYKDDVYSKDSLNNKAVSEIYKPDKFNVVYAGNIGRMQNVDVIIEAAKLLKDNKNIWFYIIGNGVYREKLQSRAEEYGIANISFFPMQPAETAPSIYGLADVNIIPLKKDVYKTALPSKTATCLASQRPVIFAIGKDSKFGQWFFSQTGCPVVESDNPKDIVEAILSFEDGSAHCKTASIYVKYFSKTINSKRYAEVITGKVAKCKV